MCISNQLQWHHQDLNNYHLGQVTKNERRISPFLRIWYSYVYYFRNDKRRYFTDFGTSNLESSVGIQPAEFKQGKLRSR